MALTKIGSIGINTGIQFAGVTTIATLNGSDSVLSVGGTVNFVSDVSIGGTVSIAGTLTYEDVTNIDAVGLITARNGVVVGSGITLSKDGDIFATGIVTASSFVGGLPITDGADNRIITATSASAIQGESGLTFDGDILSLTKSSTTAYDTAATTNDSATNLINSGAAGHSTLQFQSVSGGSANTGQATISVFNESSGSKNTALTFGTRQNSDATVRERLRIDSSGRVGINTTSPTTLLEIDTVASAAWKFRIRTSVSDGAGFYQRSNGDFELVLRDASNNNNNISGSAGGLQFTTSNTEKLRITSAGRVGIGENSPDTPLHISTPASTTCEIRLTSNNTGSSAGDRGRLNVYSAKNDGTAFNAGYIDIDRASGTETTAQMTFNVNNGSGVTEWVRIEPTGRILAARNTSGSQGLINPGVILDRQDTRVGTNSNTFNGVGIVKDSNGWGTALYIKRTSDGAGEGFFCEFAYASLATSGTTIGSISNNGSSNVSYNTSSDYRLKQDISSITDAISSLKKLTPRKFRWKTDLDLGYQDGFIAHEVQETGIFSHLVHGEKDGTKQAENEPDTIIPAYQQMDYSKLTPTLVAAVQELSAEIESLKSEIAALKSS